MCVRENPSPKLLRAEIAFRSCVPDTSRYVAIISWERHDLGPDLDKALETFQRLCEEVFDFEVYRITIPTLGKREDFVSEERLAIELQKFYNTVKVTHNGQNAQPSLCIILYGGHGGAEWETGEHFTGDIRRRQESHRHLYWCE